MTASSAIPAQYGLVLASCTGVGLLLVSQTRPLSCPTFVDRADGVRSHSSIWYDSPLGLFSLFAF